MCLCVCVNCTHASEPLKAIIHVEQHHIHSLYMENPFIVLPMLECVYCTVCTVQGFFEKKNIFELKWKMKMVYILYITEHFREQYAVCTLMYGVCVCSM